MKESSPKNEKEEPEISYSFEAVWKAIIRPPRDIYTIDELCPEIFMSFSKNYTRKDYDLINKSGHILKCSFYEMDEIDRETPSMPVIIYCHGNSSSRLEGMKYMFNILKRNINVFLFDFSGCGLSEGEYISLGYHEKDDLKTVVDFVYKLPNVSSIGLWGHSMGAATILMYAANDSKISCCIIDSAFADFSILAKELVENRVSIPGLIYRGISKFLRWSIQRKNGLDIEKLKPIEQCKKIKIPIYFVHAMNDEIIKLEHCLKLYESCPSTKKKINICEGWHNSLRPKSLQDKLCEFLECYLIKK